MSYSIAGWLRDILFVKLLNSPLYHDPNSLDSSKAIYEEENGDKRKTGTDHVFHDLQNRGHAEKRWSVPVFYRSSN
ncbi:MAG: hypothetical protein N838_10480 [Thiohalocapsa sp. PB-PSB1]|jgi:hypothetical protein|nr:MAG: hypothetical protein N838_10480 [Thiohalocapsa sp. PB-PSB1]